MWGKNFKITIISICGLLLMMTYNNCSSQFDLGSAVSQNASSANSSTSGLTSEMCEQDLVNLFSNGYYQFAKTNCAFCHTNGPGKGRFAADDMAGAYADFMQSGYTKFSNNATSSSHNPPYSGPQHVQTINELRVQWQKGLEDSNRCKGIAGTNTDENLKVEDLISFETTAKLNGVQDFNKEVEIVWNLDSEISAIKTNVVLPVTGGAKLSIKIAKHKNSGGDEYYTIRLPTVFDSQKDLHFKGIHIKVNGILLKYPTTFRYVNTDIRAGTKNDASGLISTGSIVAVKALTPSDQITLVFEDLKTVELPAAESPPVVEFSGNLVQVAPTSSSLTDPLFMDIEVKLSKAMSAPVTVSVSDDTSNICAQTGLVTLNADCLPQVATAVCSDYASNPNLCANKIKFYRARSVVGMTYNRYDWDYKFKTSSVTFAAGEISKTIRVQISKDKRFENNRLLSLQLDAGWGGAIIGNKKMIHIPFNKIVNPQSNGLTRFQDLMTPGTGILVTNCIRCHNSVKREGGYDITNYEEMLANKVLIPGNSQSKMYMRITTSNNSNAGLQPMPLDTGSISLDDALTVRDWIINGAKND